MAKVASKMHEHEYEDRRCSCKSFEVLRIVPLVFQQPAAKANPSPLLKAVGRWVGRWVARNSFMLNYEASVPAFASVASVGRVLCTALYEDDARHLLEPSGAKRQEHRL